MRANTTNRFGPVQEVTHGPDVGLVLEISLGGRRDKPPREIDQLASLKALPPDPA